MRGKIRKGLIILFLVIAIFIVIDFENHVIMEGRGEVLYVGGYGPGNYSSIQSAIDNAAIGDTIHIYNGTYYENLNINRTMSLMGHDRDSVIIRGEGSETRITIRAALVNLTGISVMNDGYRGSSSGILLSHSENCSIQDVYISNFYYGLKIVSSYNNEISYNSVINNVNGFYLNYAFNNKI